MNFKNKGTTTQLVMGTVIAVMAVMLINNHITIKAQRDVIGRAQQALLESEMDVIGSTNQGISLMIDRNKPSRIKGLTSNNQLLLKRVRFEKLYKETKDLGLGEIIWFDLDYLIRKVSNISYKDELDYKDRTYLELASKVLGNIQSIYNMEVSNLREIDYGDYSIILDEYYKIYMAMMHSLNEDDNYKKLMDMDDWFDNTVDDPRDVAIKESSDTVCKYLDELFESYTIELSRFYTNKVNFKVLDAGNGLEYLVSYNRCKDSIYIRCKDEFVFTAGIDQEKIKRLLECTIRVFKVEAYREYGSDIIGTLGLRKRFVPYENGVYDLSKELAISIDKRGRLLSLHKQGLSNTSIEQYKFITEDKIKESIKKYINNKEILDVIKVRRENGDLEYRVTTRESGIYQEYIFSGKTGNLYIKRPLGEGLSAKQIELIG